MSPPQSVRPNEKATKQTRSIIGGQLRCPKPLVVRHRERHSIPTQTRVFLFRSRLLRPNCLLFPIIFSLLRSVGQNPTIPELMPVIPVRRCGVCALRPAIHVTKVRVVLLCFACL